MNNVTVYQAPPRAYPGRDLLAALARRPATWAVLITLLGFGLRVVALDSAPPGWRDDELIESLVISRNILGGHLAFYYPDASGHEALYHALNALFLAWFGPTQPGIRLLSGFLGTLAVPLTYALGRRLFGAAVGLSAAALLAVSFWGLMYSRVGIRHSLTPVLALAAFYWFWQALTADRRPPTDAGMTNDELRMTSSKTSEPVTRHSSLVTRIAVGGRRSAVFFAAAGAFLGLGFHSYFASRGAPLVPAAFVVYLLLAAPQRLRGNWRGLLLMAVMTALVAAPLLLAVAAQPAAEGRVGEVALPLIEARAGDFGLLVDHAVAALTMAHATGDPEWLYNIPERPVFGLVGAVFFWVGVALAAVWALRPLFNRLRARRADIVPPAADRDLAAAFLLIWWLVGIAPAVLSVPPASLGHVILAQPAFYLLAALPVGVIAGGQGGRGAGGKNAGEQGSRGAGEKEASHGRSYCSAPLHDGSPPPLLPRSPAPLLLAIALAIALTAATAARDLPDYFGAWPARGMVRFLYHADAQDVADFVLRDPVAPWPADFGITGPLAGPWNRIALDLALGGRTDVRPRWYNPERALLLWPDVSFSGYPATGSPFADLFAPLPQDSLLTGDYTLARVAPRSTPTVANGQLWLNEAPQCFANGLCWVAAAYDPAEGVLELEWRLEGELDLPDMPLISNPPPPGVYAGPRLAVFTHLLDDSGALLAGDDGLWVDPETLRPGDIFLQRHYLTAPEGAGPATISFGLYDPMTGARIPTVDGPDSITLELGQ